jgi:hypothetical protein
VGRFGEGDDVEKENEQRVMGIVHAWFFFDGFLTSGSLHMCEVVRLGRTRQPSPLAS